jgi:hypothetical protein
MNHDTMAAYEAIDHYLDDLLCELPPKTEASQPVEDNAWPPSTTGYLMCFAATIRVAIPMAQVEDILQAPLDDNAESAGVGESGGQRMQVRDLSRILADDLHEPDANRVVVLNGWRWALACRISEHEAFRMDAADINWRKTRDERTTRPWLGGMHKSGNCVLIDAVMLQGMLDKQRGVGL